MRFPFWKDPSPAMQAWMDVDRDWHIYQDRAAEFDDLVRATKYADLHIAQRYTTTEVPSVNADEDKKSNVIPFPRYYKTRDQFDILKVLPTLHCNCGCELFIVTPVFLICSSCGATHGEVHA